MSDSLTNSLNQKIKEFLFLVKEINQYIQSFNNSNKEFEIREKLKGITKTISSFEQKNFSVPAELRELKTSLINNLSEIEEANKFILEFKNELRTLLNIKDPPPSAPRSHHTKEKTKDPKIFSNVKLKDVVSSGFLPPNTKIFHRGRDVDFIGTITQDGHILCSVRGSNKFFDTPSAAAGALSGSSNNGWEWWFIQQGSELIPLAKIRDQYLNNYK